MCTAERGTLHEYEQIIEQQRQDNRDKHLGLLDLSSQDVPPSVVEHLDNAPDVLLNATLKAGSLQAPCHLLTKVKNGHYEPTIFIGTHSINDTDMLWLWFVGHVLTKVQGRPSAKGHIVSIDGKSSKIRLEPEHKQFISVLEPLQEWVANDSPPDEPPVILNKHCPMCQFRVQCEAKAIHEDNLSRLKGVTAKVIRQYAKKGIFTVTQLSYIFRSRRPNKRAKNQPIVTYKPELQALAIRERKTYLQEMPHLVRQSVELFLDIEGVPDEQLYYLIGLLVYEGNTSIYYPFWADTSQDEGAMWQQFLEKVNQFPNAAIYHYGSYEPRAIAKLTNRYNTDDTNLTNQLVNIIDYIYGKIYFPTYSNRLKELGGLIGATWTSANASGLQTLIWRHHWDKTHHNQYKVLLLTYNDEDCRALKLLTDEISRLSITANSEPTVDFTDQPKQYATQTGEEIHHQFKQILRSAWANYDTNKIDIRAKGTSESTEARKRGGKKGHQGYTRVKPKTRKVIRLPQRLTCPRCNGAPLRASEKTAETIVIDMVLTRDGCRKTITKYVWILGYCQKCTDYFSPEAMSKKGMPRVFGHGFQAWVIYQRLVLRLSYPLITQALEDQYRETLSQGSIIRFINRFAEYYAETEEIIRKRVLQSPFVHVDETKINIQGDNQYVWVFTDGNHVFFKLTTTREADIAYTTLAEYQGILISDFYGGYDAVNCRQQKCLVHLIRDLNEDLWKSPLDDEFGVFVAEVRDLLVPILAAADKYGLKKRYLGKYTKHVESFYKKIIVGRKYASDLTSKYQKRFIRYRQSLFTFLELDGIPWNNNMAERAIRHLAVQRKISGAFYESVTHHYLLLLSITQTCKFQGKSVLEFLMSGEKDIDQFRGKRRLRSSVPRPPSRRNG